MPRNNIYVDFVGSTARRRKRRAPLFILLLAGLITLGILIFSALPREQAYSNITPSATLKALVFETNSVRPNETAAPATVQAVIFENPITTLAEEFKSESLSSYSSLGEYKSEDSILVLPLRLRFNMASNSIYEPLSAFMNITAVDSGWKSDKASITMAENQNYSFIADISTGKEFRQIVGEFNNEISTLHYTISLDGVFEQYAAIQKVGDRLYAQLFSMQQPCKGATGIMLEKEDIHIYENKEAVQDLLFTLDESEPSTWEEFSAQAKSSLEYYDGKVYVDKKTLR